MGIIGGREKRKRNKKWFLEEGRKNERKEGGTEGGREKERKERNKKGGRKKERRALRAGEAHTGLQGSGHAWPWLPHPRVACTRPLCRGRGGPHLGPPAQLQDFESLFLILLCRISLLGVDFLPRERHSTQHSGRNGTSDLSLGGDTLGGRGRGQCPQVRLKTEKNKESSAQERGCFSAITCRNIDCALQVKLMQLMLLAQAI